MNWFKERVKESNGTIVFSIIIIVVFTIMVTSIIIDSKNPCTGIGGFVYREIEWEDQTINVIKENCRNGLYINDWKEDEPFLYCYVDECKGR